MKWKSGNALSPIYLPRVEVKFVAFWIHRPFFAGCRERLDLQGNHNGSGWSNGNDPQFLYEPKYLVHWTCNKSHQLTKWDHLNFWLELFWEQNNSFALIFRLQISRCHCESMTLDILFLGIWFPRNCIFFVLENQPIKKKSWLTFFWEEGEFCFRKEECVEKPVEEKKPKLEEMVK